MNGDLGVSSDDLKRSGLGKTVMALYQHKDETKPMKRMMKNLIEQWSRPIYNKSKSYKDLDAANHQFQEEGFQAKSVKQILTLKLEEKLARQQRAEGAAADKDGGAGSILAGGSRKSAAGGGTGRVTIPYSKGFQFTVRPANKVDDEMERTMKGTKVKSGGVMERLNKSMIEKSRPVVKNQRSEAMSIEGRVLKN